VSVFTMYNHGTGSHREKTDGGELVTIFGSRATGVEYKDYLITDGVGYSPKTDTENPMPGTFDPMSADKSRVSRRAAVLRGNVLGTGVGDNVRRAVATIQGLLSGNHPFVTIAGAKKIDVINMVGWSRGGVTCLRIAHELHLQKVNIPINIFAIDPVAGPLKRELEGAANVKDNVKNLVITLAMDERRTTFRPQEAKRLNVAPTTNVVYLPFPGVHNTQVYINKGDAWEKAPGEVVWALAYRFLTKFGTKFTMPPWTTKLGNVVFLERYALMRMHFADFKAIGQHGFDMGARVAAAGSFRKRAFAKKAKIGEYVLDSSYFINEHHRLCFSRQFKQVDSFLFGRNGSANISKTVLCDEVASMRNRAPNTYFTLNKVFGLSQWAYNADLAGAGRSGADDDLVFHGSMDRCDLLDA
jgi:hypothetical protein